MSGPGDRALKVCDRGELTRSVARKAMESIREVWTWIAFSHRGLGVRHVCIWHQSGSREISI